MPIDSEKITSLRQKRIDLVNSGRMAGLYELMAQKGSGCLVIGAIEIFAFFFPDKTLPKNFEQTVLSSSYSNLSETSYSEVVTGLNAVIKELNLGFSVNHRESLLNIIDADKYLETFIHNCRLKSLPTMVIMRERTNLSHFHVVPITTRQFPHPFANLSGLEGVAQFKNQGFEAVAVCSFMKDDELKKETEEKSATEPFFYSWV